MHPQVTTYKDLIVWQKAMDLVTDIYDMTAQFPKHEQYGLISQMRRSAVSIPSNIAEGSRRGTRKEYVQFLRHSFGSGAELETQLEIAKRLNIASPERIQKSQKLLDEIMRMLNVMIDKIQA